MKKTYKKFFQEVSIPGHDLYPGQWFLNKGNRLNQYGIELKNGKEVSFDHLDPRIQNNLEKTLGIKKSALNRQKTPENTKAIQFDIVIDKIRFGIGVFLAAEKFFSSQLTKKGAWLLITDNKINVILSKNIKPEDADNEIISATGQG